MSKGGRVKTEVRIEKKEGARLGMTLANVRGRVVVDAIASTTALGQIKIGSWLVAVNGTEVCRTWRLNAADFASRLILKSATLTLSLLQPETTGASLA